MKFHIIFFSLNVLILTVSFTPECVHAQSSQTGYTTNSEIILLAANSISNARVFDRIRYNPAVIYSGVFKSNSIYYRNQGDSKWHMGLNVELDRVACAPAKKDFNSIGTWTGQLKLDGKCGKPIEPVVWAVGNWINFSNEKSK